MTSSSPAQSEAVFQRVSLFPSEQARLCLEILRDGIPAREHLPDSRVAELLAGEEYRLYSLEKDKEICGAAILFLPSEQNYVLLDYMAVRRGARGLGYGASLFRRLVQEAKQERPKANWFLLEVDDDREGDAEARRLNQKRIAFYQRSGAHLISNFPYRFPSSSGVEVPMRLMVLFLNERQDISAQDLFQAIVHFFGQIHGRQPDDPLVLWIRKNAPAVLKLEK